MPSYDYRCVECKTVVEISHPIDGEPASKTCAEPECSGTLKKKFTATPAIFAGDGWGKTG